jgi:hypothetical protein
MGRFGFSHRNQFMAPESATPRVRRCELGSRGVSIAAAIERALSVNWSASCAGMRKGGSMITVEANKVGTRVIATVKVGIGTGQYIYTVQFADQGSEAANEDEAQRELRKTLEEVLEALGPSWKGGLFSVRPAPFG